MEHLVNDLLHCRLQEWSFPAGIEARWLGEGILQLLPETAAASLPKDAAFYIDSDLGEGAKGEDTAAALHAQGFSDITMATGHSTDRFAAHPWLKVAGKEPPWGHSHSK